MSDIRLLVEFAEYIADSPKPEYGGFSVECVHRAKEALKAYRDGTDTLDGKSAAEWKLLYETALANWTDSLDQRDIYKALAKKLAEVLTVAAKLIHVRSDHQWEKFEQCDHPECRSYKAALTEARKAGIE